MITFFEKDYKKFMSEKGFSYNEKHKWYFHSKFNIALHAADVVNYYNCSPMNSVFDYIKFAKLSRIKIKKIVFFSRTKMNRDIIDCIYYHQMSLIKKFHNRGY